MSGPRVAFDVALAVALAAGFTLQMLRWLRVLQREHYEPASMRRFLGRWSSPPVATARSVERFKMTRPVTLSHVLVVALLVCVVVHSDVLAALTSALYGLTCPQGLSVKGRTSALHWTRRLRTVAFATAGLSLVLALVGTFTARPWLLALAVVWAVPLTLDLSARMLAPFEARSARTFVTQASERLTRVRPRIVAVTGSFGKTSTKNHLVDLLGPGAGVVATPASFNNQAGLSRAINEHLADGTRIFVAEMGTYGPGEIRNLCAWCPPEIAVVTAIGPVHLERMKSIDVIERAKFEITERASTVVLNVDDPRLEKWVARLTERGAAVRTAGSSNVGAAVRVVVGDATWTLIVDGAVVGSAPATPGVRETNVACAVAAAFALGVSPSEACSRLGDVRAVEHRSNVSTATSGVVVVDDTFNANPVSAVAALTTLSGLALPGRRVVVTPGLIELGTEEFRANRVLAKRVGAIGAELVVVGRTNVKALAEGFEGPVQRFDSRDDAVAWVRTSLGPGDGVLYLNDLPDHYP